MDKIFKLAISCLGDYVEHWKSHALMVGMENTVITLENIWLFLIKLNLPLPFDSTILLFIQSKLKHMSIQKN